MADSRRNFLRTLGIGTAVGLANPTSLLGNTSEGFKSTLEKNSTNSSDTTEAFWEDISAQFKFAKGLVYFNNGSLGACPDPIRKATTDFRDTLDDFPSKYMWGGWDTEKEQVRKQVADLFSVSEEEIALIHNTTEGMNLIARSMDLQNGDEIISADHEHSSALNPWKYWQQSKGIKIVTPTLPILPKKLWMYIKRQ